MLLAGEQNRSVLSQREGEDVSDSRLKRVSLPEDCSHVFLTVRMYHCPRCLFLEWKTYMKGGV